jgi:hypothetical protein
MFLVLHTNRETDMVEILAARESEDDANNLARDLHSNRVWWNDRFWVQDLDSLLVADPAYHESQVPPPLEGHRMYYLFDELDFEASGMWSYRTTMHPSRAVNTFSRTWIRADSELDAIYHYTHRFHNARSRGSDD